MIESVKVTGLNRRMSFDLKFNEDINVVTGRNGSGKTTLLKLIWYAMSGNLERIIPEVEFESFELQLNNNLYVAMFKERKPKRHMVRLVYKTGNNNEKKECEKPLERSRNWEELDEINRKIAANSGSSVFFPTFRRIEGGFSIANRRANEVLYTGGTAVRFLARENNGAIQDAMNELSERVSVRDHRFVASISTDDINRLLTSKYADISQKNNLLHMNLSRFILQKVSDKNGGSTGTSSDEMEETLAGVRQQAQQVNRQSEDLLRPFTVLSELITDILQYKGIKLAGPVTLGEARDAIISDSLSAGEKQMLSFLCYNAFASQACIFIDEPEISLHVDWQRILFPILLGQSTGNQFIVATHSPFIYSKYSDKELVLTADKGANSADAIIDRAGDDRLLEENQLANSAR